MFKTELENIKDRILTLIPIYQDGVVIERGKEQSIKSITDTIPNYFYIDIKEGAEVMEASFADEISLKGAISVNGEFKLVSRTCGYDLCTVASALIAAIVPGSVEITGISTDAEFIFENETDEELKKDMDLVWISFTLNKNLAPLKKCISILCKQEVC